MSCAFVSCAESVDCALVGGCVSKRFAHVPQYGKPQSDLKANAPALNGTRQRQVRDPRFMKRKRKEIHR